HVDKREAGNSMYLRTSSLRDNAMTSLSGRWPIGNLGQPAKIANNFSQCWPQQKRAIEAAFLNALASVRNAAAVLGSAYARPDRMAQRTRDLLNFHFHTTDRDNVREIFRKFFRIGQALEKGLDFKCEVNCGSKRRCGYAWATQWFGGVGAIHVCFDNRPG